MKKQILLTIAMMCASSAYAELGRKEPLKVDFHNMIVNSQQERRGLAQNVKKSIVQNKSKRSQQDQGRVTDFVDVEIGWGEAPKMVDRRFDSIGEPVIALPSDGGAQE